MIKYEPRCKASSKHAEDIRRAIGNGALLSEEICSAVGVSRHYLIFLCKAHGIKLSRRTEVCKERFRKLAEKGLTIEEIAIKEGYAASTVRRYDKIPKMKRAKRGVKRYKDRDRLISEGLAITKIARKCRITGEAVRQYIAISGQYADWKRAREQIKTQVKTQEVERKRLIGQIVTSVLEKKLKTSSTEEPIFHRKAVEYKSLIKQNRSCYDGLRLNKLILLFRVYYGAIEQGKKLSLKELGKKTGIYHLSVWKILKRVGLEPLHGAKPKTTMPEEQKNLVKRVLRSKVNMSDRDLGHFLDLIPYKIRCIREEYFTEQRPKGRWLRYGWGRTTTYHTASQVYEAQDLGFTRDEIAELLDIEPEAIDFVNEKRVEIEPKIIKLLQIIEPKKQIKKPYKE